MRKCTAVTNKGKNCPINVEDWRKQDLCHVHDPEGNFRKSLITKGKNSRPLTIQKCRHTWYMREVGIQCTKCLAIWHIGMEEDTNQ